MSLRCRAQMAWYGDNATVSRYLAFYNPPLIMTSHRHRYQAILHNAVTLWCRTHSGADVIAPDPLDFQIYHPLRHHTPTTTTTSTPTSTTLNRAREMNATFHASYA